MRSPFSLFSVLVRNTDRILKIVQIAALLWIGYELHDISTTMYTGSGPYDSDVSALQSIAEQLKMLRETIIFK